MDFYHIISYDVIFFFCHTSEISWVVWQPQRFAVARLLLFLFKLVFLILIPRDHQLKAINLKICLNPIILSSLVVWQLMNVTRVSFNLEKLSCLWDSDFLQWKLFTQQDVRIFFHTVFHHNCKEYFVIMMFKSSIS